MRWTTGYDVWQRPTSKIGRATSVRAASGLQNATSEGCLWRDVDVPRGHAGALDGYIRKLF
eukprot:619541-Lingulodinium_polyedra.AAC.1